MPEYRSIFAGLLRQGLYGVLLLLAACGGSGGSSGSGGTFGNGTDTGDLATQTYNNVTGHAAAGDTFVHLFEWKWTDIAQECPWLGANGYKAVQISPPDDHLIDAGNNYPWWQRYQTVSYSLAKSRSGTLAELQAMITACHTAGVDIYADVVLNHTTGVNYNSGSGSAGSSFNGYTFPDYSQIDFHPPCDITSTDYNTTGAADKDAIRLCQLTGLRDLDTSSATVRQKMANYLIALNAMGVAGFRIDAAKHMSSVDLDAILSQVNQAATNASRPPPYVFLEVIKDSNIDGQTYYSVGQSSGGAVDITTFTPAGLGWDFRQLGSKSGQIGTDTNFPGGWGSEIYANDKAVTFIANHDTERSGTVASISPANLANLQPWYGDDVSYRLAYVFLMGQGYGYTSVMSSYAFDHTNSGVGTGINAGPKSDSNGNTLPIYNGNVSSCKTTQWITNGAASLSNGDWVCEHRDPWMVAMVKFRHQVNPVALSNYSYVNVVVNLVPDNKVVGIQRAGQGFVFINNNTTAVSYSVNTGMAAGTYCDLITGGKSSNSDTCIGTSITVAGDQTATLSVAATTPIAITAIDKL